MNHIPVQSVPRFGWTFIQSSYLVCGSMSCNHKDRWSAFQWRNSLLDKTFNCAHLLFITH